MANTQLKNTSIRDQIRSLKLDAERTTDGSKGLKTRQFDSLTNDFKKEIQGYLAEEQQYQERYRDQIARQFRIVNPDATEEQVSEAVQTDWGNEGIFQQAVRLSPFSFSLSPTLTPPWPSSFPTCTFVGILLAPIL